MNAPQENLRTVPLLRMNRAERLDFSRRVAKSAGVAPLYVEPFIHDWEPNPIPGYDEYRSQRDEEMLDLLNASKPVVIFKGSGLRNRLPSLIGAFEERTLYTFTGNPDPIELNWNKVGDVFHSAHVQQINLGGAFRSASVARTEEKLQEQGFEVNVSLATFDLSD